MVCIVLRAPGLLAEIQDIRKEQVLAFEQFEVPRKGVFVLSFHLKKTIQSVGNQQQRALLFNSFSQNSDSLLVSYFTTRSIKSIENLNPNIIKFIHSYKLIRQLIEQQPMNIYSLLMANQQYETYFPKIIAKQKFRGNSYAHSKKNSFKKTNDRSIDNSRGFRATYHDILQIQLPLTSSEAKQQPKPPQQIASHKQMKKTFLIKPSDSAIRVGRYRATNNIGKGGFAQVHQAEDSKGDKFALKVYNLPGSLECFNNQCIVGEHFFENGEIRKKFAQKRGRSNLISFVERIKNGKKGYIVQQLGGKSLSKMLSQIQGVFHKGERVYQIKFTKFYEKLRIEKNLCKILKQIAEGIKLLNSQGFIHCDLKPENILVNSSEANPICKIIDFGSSFIYQNGLPKITITPQYMPPELLHTLQYDEKGYKLNKIDIWSFGCILLQILTGIPLWFRFKCKININGKQNLQLSFFALTNRQYHKILKKQKEICQAIKKIGFIYQQFEIYRKLLIKCLTYNEEERINFDELIAMLDQI